MQKFERVKFSGEYSDLEPYIDAKTMELHSEKHHEGYTAKLNDALEKYPEFFEYSIEELLGMLDDIPEEIRQAVRNNGGGFANHNLFFSTLAPMGNIEVIGEIRDAIEKKWGSVEDFKKEFSDKAASLFGSGWAFLALDDSGELYITTKPNQDSPLIDNHFPILGLDVWEHAYYLKYQNKRSDYIQAFWQIVNWEKVNELFISAKA
ncbi:MAG: superoxide dismutase [Candidatus Dojkabacteria bacterium]